MVDIKTGDASTIAVSPVFIANDQIITTGSKSKPYYSSVTYFILKLVCFHRCFYAVQFFRAGFRYQTIHQFFFHF